MGVRDHMPAARLVRVLFAIFCLLACFEMGCAKRSAAPQSEGSSVEKAEENAEDNAAGSALDNASPGDAKSDDAAPGNSTSDNEALDSNEESWAAIEPNESPNYGGIPPRAVPAQPPKQANSTSGLNWSGPGRNAAPTLSDGVSTGSGPRRPPPSSLSLQGVGGGAGLGTSETGDRQKPTTSDLGNLVEVFYATDRLPTAALMPSLWRSFAPVAVVWMIGGALCLGFSMTRRFHSLWLVASALAVCLGVTVLHASIIRWQQYSRLAHNADTRFSSSRDSMLRDYPLHLGTARVTLPSTHRPGRFEQPQLYRFEFVESADKHIVLHSLQEQPTSAAWFNELSQVAQASDRNELFVFIHGYNVRFIDALKRTAQLSHDLELQGPAVCYSWPSRGDVAAYTMDEASVSWSAPHFEHLLLDLRDQTGCQRVNVIAHSMGNRALLEAIERIDAKKLDQPKLIDSLVMAAPDVDLGEFSSRYLRPLQNVTKHTTLYFSDSDRALLLSARLHGAPRLGLLRDHLQAFAGIDSVYVGEQASLSLGHSYYGDDPAVIEDLKTLLQEGRTADSRELLRNATNSAGVSFWQLDRSLHAQRPAASMR